MAQGTVFKKLVAIFCLVGSGFALYNVYSDVSPLQAKAAETACGAGGCSQLLGMERTPLSQVFTFQVRKGSANTARVVCRRGMLLFGDYDCTRESQ
jgi:hypothetical protein